MEHFFLMLVKSRGDLQGLQLLQQWKTPVLDTAKTGHDAQWRLEEKTSEKNHVRLLWHVSTTSQPFIEQKSATFKTRSATRGWRKLLSSFLSNLCVQNFAFAKHAPNYSGQTWQGIWYGSGSWSISSMPDLWKSSFAWKSCNQTTLAGRMQVWTTDVRQILWGLCETTKS